MTAYLISLVYVLFLQHVKRRGDETRDHAYAVMRSLSLSEQAGTAHESRATKQGIMIQYNFRFYLTI